MAIRRFRHTSGSLRRARTTRGVVDEIENPNAQPGTNNWYTQDGYGGGSYGSMSYGGGTYSNCSDSDARCFIRAELPIPSLPYEVDPKCAPGHYYLLNNYNPEYYGNGRNAYADITNANQTVFTISPSNLRTIGDALHQEEHLLGILRRSMDAYPQILITTM